MAFDGNVMKITQIYDMAGMTRNADGKDVAKLTISGINHVPGARFNLFSGPYAVSQGWKFFGDSSGVTLTKGQAVLKFDLLIPTGAGYLYAITIVPEGTQDIAAVSIENEGTKDINNDSDMDPEVATNASAPVPDVRLQTISRQLAHYRWCHLNAKQAVESAKYIGYGIYKPRKTAPDLPLAQRVTEIVMCESCALSRVTRKGASKDSSHTKAKTPNERVYIDIATVKYAGGERVTRGVCIGIIDEHSSYGTMLFVNTKEELPSTLCK